MVKRLERKKRREEYFNTTGERRRRQGVSVQRVVSFLLQFLNRWIHICRVESKLQRTTVTARLEESGAYCSSATGWHGGE